MATNYPTSKDDNTTLPNPTTGAFLNSPSHAGQHDNVNDATKAIQTKLGTGASTPVANTFLFGTGTGASTWQMLTSAAVLAAVSDETGTGNLVFNTTPTLITPKVDTINESTGGNGVTTAGMNVKSGVIQTSNSVITTNITDANVTPAKLVAGTGTSWVYQSWSPTFANWTIGTGGSAGTIAKYGQIGKTVHFWVSSTLGTSGQSVGASATFTLPVTPSSSYPDNSPIGVLKDSNNDVGFLWYTTTGTKVTLIFQTSSSTYAQAAPTSSTVPFSWAAGSSFTASGTYQVD